MPCLSRLCNKSPHKVERCDSRTAADRLPVARDVEPLTALAHRPRRVQKDEPDRLGVGAAVRAGDARHGHGDIGSEPLSWIRPLLDKGGLAAFAGLPPDAPLDPARIARRTQLGEHLLTHLGGSFISPGFASEEHSYWVFPVLADDSARLIAALRAAGFDGSSAHSMCVVQPPADRPAQRATTAERILPRIVFLPLYNQLYESELERMADVAQQLISPVQVSQITAFAGSNQLEVVNMPIGLNGFVDGVVDMSLTNWASLKSFSSTNTTQTVFVTSASPQWFYRLRFPYAWSWP